MAIKPLSTSSQIVVYNDEVVLTDKTAIRNHQGVTVGDILSLAADQLPIGGDANQVLQKNSNANYDYSWQSINEVPSGGGAGQVLTKAASGYNWEYPTQCLTTVSTVPGFANGSIPTPSGGAWAQLADLFGNAAPFWMNTDNVAIDRLYLGSNGTDFPQVGMGVNGPAIIKAVDIYGTLEWDYDALADIATNESNIATNTSNIATNTSDIATINGEILTFQNPYNRSPNGLLYITNSVYGNQTVHPAPVTYGESGDYSFHFDARNIWSNAYKFVFGPWGQGSEFPNDNGVEIRNAGSLYVDRDAHIGRYATIGTKTMQDSTNNQLEVWGGDIFCDSDVVAFSDRRVKENIETIPNALDKVNAMRGVFFNKKSNGEHSTGVIAQEIEEVLPQVVKTREDGMKSVAYGNIAGVLIEAIKELSAEVEQLKAK